MLTKKEAFVKRVFDIILSALGLVITGWIIALATLMARFDTGKSGLFRQTRLGHEGRLFKILKIRTMREIPGMETSVTASDDLRITRLGSWLRRTKIDELPQLVNVLRGEMSFVGPRPDVPEIANRLKWEAPEILMIRPGITGPASLKYRREELILAMQDDPETWNSQQIFPDKILINQSYLQNYSFWYDIKYLWQTLSGSGSFILEDEWEVSSENDKRAA